MDFYILLLIITIVSISAGLIALVLRVKNKQIQNLEEMIAKEKQEVFKLKITCEHLYSKINDGEKNQTILKQQFENLANRIFNEKNERFRSETQYNLNNILTPLKEKINEFGKTIGNELKQQNKEQFSLKNEISRIVTANDEMQKTTKELTEALKNDSKTQGNWGEIILEKILEISGLREGHEYTSQAKGMLIKTPDGGRTLKPDIVIHLPGNKHIIVDAKVSLKHYEEYTSTNEEHKKQILLKNIILSIKNHVNSLSSKTYHNNEKLLSPQLTIMFVPIENALALAMQEERELFDYAWKRHIVIASPTILFATLRTISSLWVTQRGNMNATKIVQQGGLLYDKIVGFIEDMEKMGQTIDTTRNVYDKAMIKLKGKGSLVTRSLELSKLGIRSKKELPDILKQD